MILWLHKDLTPKSQTLENFLFSFRVRKVAEAIANGCDLAVVPMGDYGQINLLVPRDSGTFHEVTVDWHLNVAPHYPYTEIIAGSTGVTGLTEDPDGFLRLRMVSGKIEAIDVWVEDYASVILSLVQNHDLRPWFVYQPDSTLRFSFRVPEEGLRHTDLSLDMVYHPEEYLARC